MSTTHRKTAKGQTEVETRANRLQPRLRQVLILVDGRRSDEEFAKMLPGAPELLAELEAGQFVEVVAMSLDQAAPRPAPPPLAPPPPPRTFEQRRGAAVRNFIDLVGPMSEALAIKMERTTTLAELRPLLEVARSIIANARGAQAAADYTARHIERS